MMDGQTSIDKNIEDFLRVHLKLGDRVGGSGHMAHVSLGEITIIDQKEIRFNDKPAIELRVSYILWFEREFEMTDDNIDLFREAHELKLILQNDVVQLVTAIR